LDLSLVKEPPPVPSESVLKVKGATTKCYSQGSNVYFTSKDGSVISLDLLRSHSKGFLKEEILDDKIELFSLITGTVLEILKHHGLYYLHGAALQRNGVGYLVSGDGGCGKTTTALSLVCQGYNYVSDDSLFFQEATEQIVLRPVYTNFHVDQDLCERFSVIRNGENQTIPEGVKISVDISETFPTSFVPFIRPNVIIFPKITGDRTSKTHPLGSVEVFQRLLKQIMLAVDKSVARNQLSTLGRLVKQVSGFELQSGKDLYEDPSRIISIIEQLK
jgi:hypothetical protein